MIKKHIKKHGKRPKSKSKSAEPGKKKTTTTSRRPAKRNAAQSKAKNISPAEWQSVRKMLKTSTVAEISEKYDIPVSQIYARKKRWDIIDYKSNPKFAKYHSPEYNKLRNDCLKRDNYSCVVCGRNKQNSRVILQVNHWYSQSLYPELKFDLNNVFVLCLFHHSKTPNYRNKAKTFKHTKDDITREQWIRQEKMLWKTKQLKKKIKKKK